MGKKKTLSGAQRKVVHKVVVQNVKLPDIKNDD